MIIINNFKKKYKDNLILDIDHFTFLKNKSYLIVGSNGSGKSTMIKCILGINKVSSGSITINTKNIAYIPEKYFFPEFFVCFSIHLKIAFSTNTQNTLLNVLRKT